MKFSLDYYENFYDYHNCRNEECSKITEDFSLISNNILRDCKVDPYCITSITNCIFSSMTSDKNHYHTPVHVLAMFKYAQDNKIKLQNHEKLAIIFHDVIYRPGNKFNEELSVKFMTALLAGTNISQDVLKMAGHIIQETAQHHLTYSNPISDLVMDLDLIGFLSLPKAFRLQNDLIEKEFCQEDLANYGILKVELYNGRTKFLDLLYNKEKLFKTNNFNQQHESIAKLNIKNEISFIKIKLETLLNNAN